MIEALYPELFSVCQVDVDSQRGRIITSYQLEIKIFDVGVREDLSKEHTSD